MTLAELNNKCRSKTHAGSILYVFDSEIGADNWILDHSDNPALKNEDWELICVLCSDFVPDYSLKKELCDAEVECFYAIDSDKLVVVIEKDWNNDK